MPFERQALAEHYCSGYIARRQYFFSSILHVGGLWHYFQLLDRNLENELEQIRLQGNVIASPARAVYSDAHAKIRISIELAFMGCFGEACSIMKDAIWFAVCAHYVHADCGLQMGLKGSGSAPGRNGHRVFAVPKRAVPFKGQPMLRSRWLSLVKLCDNPARQFLFGRNEICDAIRIFRLLSDASLIEDLIFHDHRRIISFSAGLLQNRAEVEELSTKLAARLGDQAE